MALKKSELYSSLWASCDELRGGMDASQYKDYVLAVGMTPVGALARTSNLVVIMPRYRQCSAPQWAGIIVGARSTGRAGFRPKGEQLND